MKMKSQWKGREKKVSRWSGREMRKREKASEGGHRVVKIRTLSNRHHHHLITKRHSDAYWHERGEEGVSFHSRSRRLSSLPQQTTISANESTSRARRWWRDDDSHTLICMHEGYHFVLVCTHIVMRSDWSEREIWTLRRGRERERETISFPSSSCYFLSWSSLPLLPENFARTCYVFKSWFNFYLSQESVERVRVRTSHSKRERDCSNSSVRRLHSRSRGLLSKKKVCVREQVCSSLTH